MSGERVVRALLLIAVVSGLLGMHVLSGGSHALHLTLPVVPGPQSAVTSTHATGHHTFRSPPAAPSAYVAAGPGGAVPAWTTVAAAPSSVTGEPGESAADGAATLCLLVLLTVTVLLVLPRWSGHALAPTAVRVCPWQRNAAPARGPPRDLLAQLCVLRT